MDVVTIKGAKELVACNLCDTLSTLKQLYMLFRWSKRLFQHCLDILMKLQSYEFVLISLCCEKPFTYTKQATTHFFTIKWECFSLTAKKLLKQYYTICIFIGHKIPTPNQWFVQLQIKWCKRNATCFLCLILEAWNLARTRGVGVAYQWGYCLQCEGIDTRHGQWQDGYRENSLHQDTILQLP